MSDSCLQASTSVERKSPNEQFLRCRTEGPTPCCAALFDLAHGDAGVVTPKLIGESSDETMRYLIERTAAYLAIAAAWGCSRPMMS